MERMALKMRQHFKESSEEAEEKFKKVEIDLAKVKKQIEKAKKSAALGN